MARSVAPLAPRRRLADDLRAAIDGGEIELRYQPQVTIATGEISGVEVLARWRHARLGELGAAKLFAAATRAALLPALSRHIHAASLAAVERWPASLAHLDVALNVTASDLARADVADELLGRAAAHGIAPARLTVEVTEHELIADLDAAAARLARLRAAGVRVALDDFGSGYSSIAYLKALPLDYLKIDGGLAGDMLGTPREQVVVRHVIAMARELGLGVIAEGVESEAHRAVLAEAGATHYQGFLCAPPLDGAALARLMEA
ncbi:EAL domain-containing protein [Sphingomonas sp.]|uniref:EAL domain-containing protein n=1 Tax=Sphingomonas sp. TaxID=28214 RepID=UPI003AFFCCE6